MAKKRNLSLSVLFFREGEAWVAQCLEYDLNAHGRTIDEAKRALQRTLIGQIAVDVFFGNPPLSDIKEAPGQYWDLFSNAKKLEASRSFRFRAVPSSKMSIRAEASDLRVFA